MRIPKGWVAGERPARGAQDAPPRREVARARLLRGVRRESLGRPLAAALRVEDRRPRSLAKYLLVALGIACLLAGIVTPWMLTLAAMFLGCAAVVEAVRRRTRDAAVPGGSDDDAIRELDENMRETAPLLSDGTRATLAEIKETLAEVLRLLRNAEASAAVSLADRCFVQESVRRYLPDACRHYMALVRAASGPAWEDARVAAELSLRRQLDALRRRLAQILAAAIATRAQTLRQHETFIAGKRS